MDVAPQAPAQQQQPALPQAPLQQQQQAQPPPPVDVHAEAHQVPVQPAQVDLQNLVVNLQGGAIDEAIRLLQAKRNAGH